MKLESYHKKMAKSSNFTPDLRSTARVTPIHKQQKLSAIRQRIAKAILRAQGIQ